MKTAAQAAQAAQRSLQNSPSSSGLDEIAKLNKRASKLWLRMAELYGHKWSSQMGTAPSELWLRALSGLSDDQISEGINACLHSDDTWPPSLPEFVSRCRPPKRENAAMYRNQPKLPAPSSSTETASRHLAEARKALRGAARG